MTLLRAGYPTVETHNCRSIYNCFIRAVIECICNYQVFHCYPRRFGFVFHKLGTIPTKEGIGVSILFHLNIQKQEVHLRLNAFMFIMKLHSITFNFGSFYILRFKHGDYVS